MKHHLLTFGAADSLSSLFILPLALSIVSGHSGGKHNVAKRNVEFDEFYVLQAQCDFNIADPNDSPLPCPIPNISDDLLRTDNFNMFGFISVNSVTNNTRIEVYGQGFPVNSKTTAWFITYPNPLPSPYHPIFDYHHRSFPVASTKECYDAGRSGFEANQMVIDRYGNGKFIQDLDFNPLIPFQSPLPNELAAITQQLYPETIGDTNNGEYVYDKLKQNPFKSTSQIQPIHREFLREFNDDGTQRVDENGLPVLLRFHLPLYMMPIVVHIDGLTHGLASGIFNPNILTDSDLGDHYELGQFVLANKVEITFEEKIEYVKKCKRDMKPNGKPMKRRYSAKRILE